MDAIAAAASDAPAGPGVYFMLTAGRELVYIGKAGHLRRRLQQHAKAAAAGDTRQDVIRGATVADVRWEEVATEADAADREADLVVALAPALNGGLVGDGRWTYVDVETGARELRFRLTTDASSPVIGRRFGCFPHLGPGGSARRSNACTTGLAAFLRLVWAAGATDDRASCPAAIAGSSVRSGEVTLPKPEVPNLAGALTRAFNGTSAAVVGELLPRALESRPRFAHPGLRADAEAARSFLDHGPRAIRELRRRHGLGAGPVSREDVIGALRAEVTALLGPFHVMGGDAVSDRLVGRRRGRAIAQRARRM